MIKWIVLIALGFFGFKTFAQSASQSAGSGSDKLDLQKLEDKYWAAKDTDFSVVQNRTYTKANRYFGSFSYGPLMNDPYSNGRMTNFALGYYFSERFGMEFAMERGALVDNAGTSKYRDTYGVNADYNRFVEYKSVNMIWVPFYAKMSFLDRAIVYFDMQFALGIGNMAYESQTNLGGKSGSTTGFNIDFTQQLFFSEHWAARLDVKNKWTNQDRYRYQLTGTQTEADRKLPTSSVQDTTILLGLTFFY
ncbi:MAG: hypothetical protein BroJett040_23380 [Oligoflexia bacterium]|nr:MAG: hypothetical protein BroJett040_23380 [Oligoflexia bacterium]